MSIADEKTKTVSGKMYNTCDKSLNHNDSNESILGMACADKPLRGWRIR